MADIVDNRRRLRLAKPVTLLLRGADGNDTEQVVSELVFKEEAEGKDFMTLEPKKHGEMGMLVHFVASLTGQPVRVIEKLKGQDYWDAIGVAKDFLPDSLPT